MVQLFLRCYAHTALNPFFLLLLRISCENILRIVEDNFFLLLLLCQSSNKNLTEGKAKVITDGWMPHQPFSARMIWRKGWIEEETLGRMDALEKMDDHPVHYPPKMDVLPKISLLIIYAAKWLVRHWSTCLKQQWQTVPSLLPDSYSTVCNQWSRKQEFVKAPEQ